MLLPDHVDKQPSNEPMSNFPWRSQTSTTRDLTALHKAAAFRGALAIPTSTVVKVVEVLPHAQSLKPK